MIDNFKILGQIIFLEMWLKTIHKDNSRVERLRGYANGLKFGLKTTHPTESD